jgi:hypothetical protein
MFDLIKFVISSHESLNQLNNKLFVKLLNPKLKITGYFYFRNKVLPEILKLLKTELAERLKIADSITLIPDIWDYKREHFLGLAAALINRTFERQYIVLGIESIDGYSSESINKYINKILAQYDFNKANINGMSFIINNY